MRLSFQKINIEWEGGVILDVSFFFVLAGLYNNQLQIWDIVCIGLVFSNYVVFFQFRVEEMNVLR